MLLDNKSHGVVADVLRNSMISSASLSMLTSKFSLYAFAALQSELGSLNAIRILFSNTQSVHSTSEHLACVQGLQGEPIDRRARNSLQSPAWARSCANLIRSNAQVKLVFVPVSQNLFHIHSDGSPATAIQGSSTFTSVYK